MNIMFQILLLVLSCTGPGGVAENVQTEITTDPVKVGDKAPPLKIIKWVKGDSIKSFQKGRIYLVEFGFVFCPGCYASIPHLTEISKKYKDRLSVIDVHIWENDKSNPSDLSYISKVEYFVKKMGDKIGYSVAVDVPDQTTADTWGASAPKSFIIDGNGIVIWIGEPKNLDPVLNKIFSRQFNQDVVAKKDLKEKKLYEDRFNSIWVNKQNKKFDLAVKQIDSLIHDYPKESWLYYEKFRVLDGIDSNNWQANSFVGWLLKTRPKEFSGVYYLIHAIIESKHPNYELALKVADWALDSPALDFVPPFIYDAKASAYFKMGNLEKAIELEQVAIDVLDKNDPGMKDVLKSFETILQTYKKKLQSSQY